MFFRSKVTERKARGVTSLQTIKITCFRSKLFLSPPAKKGHHVVFWERYLCASLFRKPANPQIFDSLSSTSKLLQSASLSLNDTTRILNVACKDLKTVGKRGGGGGGGVRGYDSSHFLRTENSFGIIWSSPRQLRVKNTLRVGHRGPVGRKTTQKPPQNTKKWKKIVKKRLFSRFGHFGQNSDFSRKKSKTGIFFDITKPPLAQIYPKSGL